MKRMILCGLTAVCLFAQQPSTADVNINDGPSRNAYQEVYGYDTGNLVYHCWAFASEAGTGARSRRSVAISAATNANPVVFTSTGHGFATNSRPVITIVGGTGNWAKANATWTATVVDANTFSVPLNSAALGALAGSLTFTTTAPRTTQYEWAVQVKRYDASNQLVWAGWLGGSTTFSARCSDGASTTLNIQ